MHPLQFRHADIYCISIRHLFWHHSKFMRKAAGELNAAQMDCYLINANEIELNHFWAFSFVRNRTTLRFNLSACCRKMTGETNHIGIGLVCKCSCTTWTKKKGIKTIVLTWILIWVQHSWDKTCYCWHSPHQESNQSDRGCIILEYLQSYYYVWTILVTIK